MKNPPNIKLETLEQNTLHNGYLGIDRRKVKISYPENHEDKFATVDSVIRNAYDAVAIIAHYELNGIRYIYLRSCLRPALMFRDYETDSGRPEKTNDNRNIGNTFEVAAGLIDTDERGCLGIVKAAQRELYEEIGINVQLKDLNPLGPRNFSCVGIMAERIYFFEVEVDPTTKEIPGEDGGPFECGGTVHNLTLTEAINAVEDGILLDSKTQMAIMRLAKKFGL